MKYILTETQLKLLVEQAPPTLTSSNQTSALQPTTNVKSGTINSTFGTGEGDLHSFMTVLQIGTAFIPLVGPFISMGVGLADAAMYYNEGDTKTAGLVGVFAMIPGIGGLASKMGLSSWTAKALGEIGKKISLGLKLSPVEIQVGKKVAQYKNLIQQEIAKVGVSAAKQNVKKRLVKKAIINNELNTLPPLEFFENLSRSCDPDIFFETLVLGIKSTALSFQNHHYKILNSRKMSLEKDLKNLKKNYTRIYDHPVYIWVFAEIVLARFRVKDLVSFFLLWVMCLRKSFW